MNPPAVLAHSCCALRDKIRSVVPPLPQTPDDERSASGAYFDHLDTPAKPVSANAWQSLLTLAQTLRCLTNPLDRQLRCAYVSARPLRPA
jgi:hypothetical protein